MDMKNIIADNIKHSNVKTTLEYTDREYKIDYLILIKTIHNGVIPIQTKAQNRKDAIIKAITGVDSNSIISIEIYELYNSIIKI